MPDGLLESRMGSKVRALFRRGDAWLLIGIVLAVAVFAVVYFATRTAGAYAVVIQNGKETARYALSQPCEVPLKSGDAVTNVLVIENGQARIETANCPDQICVEHRAVSKTGETIVCLPNELVIKIEAATDYGTPDMVV